MIDLWMGRREYSIECYYWKQVKDEDKGNATNAISYKPQQRDGNFIQYDGIFYAKEISNYINEDQWTASFNSQRQTVTLETRDIVDGLKANDRIAFDNDYWFVVSVQKAPVKKQRYFMTKSKSYVTIITVRR